MIIEPPRDRNLEVAGALQDYALVHESPPARMGYRRAARSMLRLERPVEELARAGGLREVRGIGPASERIALEVLERGSSLTVEKAIAAVARTAEIAAARSLRRHFLSRAAVIRILSADAPDLVGAGDLRGDLQMHTRWSDGAED